MEKKQSAFKEKSPCSVKYAPVPEFITCPKCGEDVELWTDEEETHCIFCGYRVFRSERIVN